MGGLWHKPIELKTISYVYVFNIFNTLIRDKFANNKKPLTVSTLYWLHGIIISVKMSQHFQATQIPDKILRKNKHLSQTSKVADFVGSQVSKSKKKKEMEFIKTNH